MATPLINKIRSNGGTIYVFNSSANDIAKTFSDDNFRFTFSKFAALDLPTAKIPNNNSNNIVYTAIGNRLNTSGTSWKSDTVISDILNGTSQKNNVYLANSFQNYVLNWENLILNQQNSDGNLYDNKNYQTVTERLFWKWLIDLGCIRFNNADITESNVHYTGNSFVEEKENTKNSSIDTYNSVVKYLGNIDLINNVNRGGEAYTQVYLHIPTEHGNTPTVLFTNLSDNNYKPTQKWYGTNSDLLEGRTNPADPNLTVNAYFYDSVGDFYGTANSFNDVSNTEITLATDTDFTNTYTVKLSNLDGVVIDWETQNYTKITNNPTINSLSDFNSSDESDSFSFNTVLIYYDIYNESDNTIIKRNLYGVLFIDDFQETLSDGAKLKSFTKYKPNKVTKLNGNAYSLKTNIKFDTSADNVGVERSINEYTTFSMDLFSDVMVQLQDSYNFFIQQNKNLITVQEKIDNLEKYYFNNTDLDKLTQTVSDLQKTVNNALISLESPSTLLELIRNNSTRISKLAAGQLTSELSYDLTPFVQGTGLKLDKSVPNKIILSNTVQTYQNFPICYNESKMLDYSTNNGTTDKTSLDYPIKNNILSLGVFANYYKNKTSSQIINNSVIINIDDSLYTFKTGQTYKIVFENEFILSDNNYLYIYTDAKNKKQLGEFMWLICKLSNNDFLSKKPIIEITCTDETTQSFSTDILR